MRGEYRICLCFRCFCRGSPPLARGVLCKSPVCNTLIRITPACAGSTPSGSDADGDRKDHPRLRGEYEFGQDLESEEQGSPPLARGVQSFSDKRMVFRRITPACAGSTNRFHSDLLVNEDHPRLRGEYAKNHKSFSAKRGVH